MKTFILKMAVRLSLGGCFFLVTMASVQAAETNYKFDFGNGKVEAGYRQVTAGMLYSKEKGYGFEPGATIREVDRGGDALRGDYVTSGSLFKFSVALPEGNYRVTVILGDASGESRTTVKAENRRLYLEGIATARGKFEVRTFVVNIRTPELSLGNAIKLDTREWNAETNTAVMPTWDDKLTLQFSDTNPCVCAVEIEPAQDAVTVFLIGDSTVTDQTSEPYGTWGQYLPRWFDAPVVIANHAESGQTVRAFTFQRRWDKVMDQMKAGDYVFIQLGTNDTNKKGHDGMWPAADKAGDWVNTHSDANTDYQWLLASMAVQVSRRGGIPVIVSPMTKMDKKTGLINAAGLGDYPKGAQAAARLANCVFIDLNAMSVQVVEGLGTTLSPAAYVDGLHTNAYGGYLLSRCIVEGMRKANLDIVRFLTKDAGVFDPAQPKPLPVDFKVPLEPAPQMVRPALQAPAPQSGGGSASK